MRRLYLLLILLAPITRAQENESAAERIIHREQEFDTYIVDFRTASIAMYWKDQRGELYANFGNLKQQLKVRGRELLFATNAGMFDPTGKPVGWYIEHGKEHVALDTGEGNGNFYMMPNGVFMWKNGKPRIMTTSKIKGMEADAEFATQSGPMLLISGKMHPAFREGSENKYIRSGVGILDEHRAVFAISRGRCNFYDFASLFQDKFKCMDALYLDGAISKMYAPELDRFETAGNFGAIIGVSRASN